MLVDWLSLRLELRSADDMALLDSMTRDKERCERLRGGEIVGRWWPRESIKTDTHQIVVGFTSGAITITGSPARVCGASNVFGSGDPKVCAESMIAAARKAFSVFLPPVTRWKATRIDLTQNYDCGDHVQEALESLKSVSGGHLRCDARQKYSVSWNPGSDLWSAIAYAKGPHLQKQAKRGLVSEPDENVALAHRLLRLEVRLRNQYIRRTGIDICAYSEDAAMIDFEKFAGKIIPENAASITSEQQFAERVVALFGRRRARTLLGTWALIQQIGEQGAKERMSRATWYRDQSDLFEAGLSRGDFSARNLLAFRPCAIVARPVDCWEDLRRAA